MSSFPYQPNESAQASDFIANYGSGGSAGVTAAGSSFANGTIASPRQGTGGTSVQAWANLIDEYYSLDSVTWLHSPIFDLTGVTGYQLEFELWIRTLVSGGDHDAGMKLQVSTDGGTTWVDVNGPSIAYNGTMADIGTTYGDGTDCWKGTSLGGANSNTCRVNMNTWANEDDVRFRWCFLSASATDTTEDGPVIDSIRVVPVVASVGYAGGYAAVPQGQTVQANISKTGGSAFTTGMTVTLLGSGVSATVVSVTNDDNCVVEFVAGKTADVGAQTFHIYSGTTRICEGICSVFYPQQLIPNRQGGTVQEPPLSAVMGGNGVYLHNGEFRHDLPIVSIPGRMLPLGFGITYRSQLSSIGAVGAGWTASFEHYLTYSSSLDQVQLYTGDGRIEIFPLKSGGTAGAGPYQKAGYFFIIERNNNSTTGTEADDVYTIKYAHGSQSHFGAANLDTAGQQVFRESNFQDRFGNVVIYEYNGSGQLGTIYGDLFDYGDGTRHKLEFDYNAHGRLSKVTDYASYTGQQSVIGSTFTGNREWEFFYNSSAQLIEIRLPKTEVYHSETKGANYRARVQFTYDSGDNLLEVIDARQANGSSPIGWLRNHYDGSDRVDYQDVGRTSSGDTTHRQTIIWGSIDGNGQRYVDVVNALKYRSRYQVQASGSTTPLGTLLNVRHYTGEWNTNSPPTSTAGQIRGTDEAYYETSYEYDTEFHVAKVTLPRGNYTRFLYDTSATDQRAKGNLLRVLSHAGSVSTSTLPADQVNGLLATFTYTSVADGNLLATSVSPRAYELGGGYNFAANTGITTDNSSHFTTTNTYYGASDPDGPKGSLKKTTTPTVSLADTSPGSLNDGQYLETLLKYNSFGQVVWASDQAGVRTEYEYGASGFGLGYLYKVKAGANNTYPNITEFGYNSVGRTITTIDPKGFTYTSYVNQLDQVVKAETPQIAEAANVKYYVQFVYDLNGNLTTRKVSLFTETGSNPYPYTVDTTTAYNILDLATSVVEPIDSSTTRTTSFSYDLLYRHVETTLPEGNKTATDYDELNRAIKAYAGFDTTNVVKSGALIKGEVFFDENSNSIRHLDGRGNDSHTYFDAYDRGYKVEDRLSSNPNYSLFEYNAAGQVVKAQRKGVMNIYNPTLKTYTMQTNSILAEKLVDYDNIGRAYRTRVTAESSAGATLTGVGDSYSTSLVKFRANGQVEETRDDYGIPTKYEYDSYNRLRRVIDDRDGTGNDDNEDEYTYDANGNVIYVTARLWDDADPSTGPHKVLTTGFQYDSLNRLIQETAPNSAVKTWRYDSRSNMVKSVDRGGVTRSTEYDLQGRPVRRKAHDITRRAIDPGTGLVSLDDHDIASRTIFDKNSNAREAIDPHGNRTYFRYDLADRWLQTQHADGGSSTPNKTTAGSTHTISAVGSTPFHSKGDAYDENSNLLKLTDPNGTVTTWTYDANDMMTLETGDWSAAPSGFEIQGEDEVNYAFDGMYRAVSGQTHDSAGQLTEFFRAFNTIGCVEGEQQDVYRTHAGASGPLTAGIVASTWDSLGRRTRREIVDAGIRADWTFDRKHRPTECNVSIWNPSGSTWTSPAISAQYEYLGGGLLHSRQVRFHPAAPNTPVISTFKRDNMLRLTSVRHVRDDAGISAGHRLLGRFDYAYDANSMMLYEARWYRQDQNGQSTTPDEVDFYGFENDSELYKAVYNVTQGSNDSAIDISQSGQAHWQDVLDDNDVTHSDRVVYARRLAGTRQRVNWYRGQDARTDNSPGSLPDGSTTPSQTTNYETSDDPTKHVDSPAGDGQGSRHNYTVIGQVSHTWDKNRNLLADPTREFRYNYKNQLRRVWRKSDGEAAGEGLVVTYREDALARQVYTESYWELAKRFYLDTRFEVAVNVDADSDGADMILVDGGMHGTTAPTDAADLQEAQWPSGIVKDLETYEAHYFDFLVDVPEAPEDTYLGYVSYEEFEVRIFSDRYETWTRTGSTPLETFNSNTQGRHNIGIRAGDGHGVWIDGTRYFGGPSLQANPEVWFGSKAVSIGGGDYAAGLVLFENLNYYRAYNRCVAGSPEELGALGGGYIPRGTLTGFDGPEPIKYGERIDRDTWGTFPNGGGWDNVPIARRAGDPPAISDMQGAGYPSSNSGIDLPNGKGRTGLTIQPNADNKIANVETGELEEYTGEGYLVGVAAYTDYDAVGTSACVEISTAGSVDGTAKFPQDGGGYAKNPDRRTGATTSQGRDGMHGQTGSTPVTSTPVRPRKPHPGYLHRAAGVDQGKGVLAAKSAGLCTCEGRDPSQPDAPPTFIDLATLLASNSNGGAAQDEQPGLYVQLGGDKDENQDFMKQIKSAFGKFGVGLLIDKRTGKVTEAFHDYSPTNTLNTEVLDLATRLVNARRRVDIRLLENKAVPKDQCAWRDTDGSKNPNIGSGALVDWSPFLGLEVDPDLDERYSGGPLAGAIADMEQGRQASGVIPPGLILIHELIHALHGVDGEVVKTRTAGVDVNRMSNQEEERTITGRRRNASGTTVGTGDPLNEQALAKWLNDPANKRKMSIPVRKGHRGDGLDKKRRPALAKDDGWAVAEYEVDGEALKRTCETSDNGLRRVKVEGVWGGLVVAKKYEDALERAKAAREGGRRED